MDTTTSTCEHEPVDLLLYTTGKSTFVKAMYESLTHITIAMKGAGGGSAADGTPGKPGETRLFLVPAKLIPDAVHLEVGAPGRGSNGQPAGEPGHVLVSVYDCGCQP